MNSKGNLWNFAYPSNEHFLLFFAFPIYQSYLDGMHAKLLDSEARSIVQFWMVEISEKHDRDSERLVESCGEEH